MSLVVRANDALGGGSRTHHIRLAVTDGPDGDQAVIAPQEREAAWRLKSRVRGAFWCTTQAGGCGGRMHLVIGTVNRVHFRHGNDAMCALRTPERVEASYEHLGYQLQLRDWLVGQGYRPRLEKVFTDGLGRTDVHVSAQGVEHSIEVQLSPISSQDRADRRTRYECAVDQLTWLFGAGARGAALEERASAGYALVLRRSVTDPGPDGGGLVEVGVSGAALKGTRWVSLTTCSFNRDGFYHPHIKAALEAFATAAERRAEDEASEAERAAAEREEAFAAADRAKQHQQALDAMRARQQGRLRGQQRSEGLGPTRPMSGRTVLPPASPSEPTWRTMAQWRAHHPEAAGWAPRGGWWRADVDETTRFVAYLVGAIHGGGPVAMFDLPDVEDYQQLVDELTRRGLIEQYVVAGVRRWRR